MKKWSIFDSLTRRLNDILILLVLAAGVVIVLGGLLYLVKTGWALYELTAVGGHYSNRYGIPRLIYFICSINILALTVKTTLISLGISVATAFISRFLGLSSQLYDDRSLSVRILLWVLPISWLSALAIQENEVALSLLSAFLLALLPAIALLNQAFRFARGMVPELELLLSAYPSFAQFWEWISRSLSLIFLSTVFTAITLHLMRLLFESGFNMPEIGPFHVESPSWGRIPLDLTPLVLLEAAVTLTVTVFCMCAVPAILGQLLHAIKRFYLPLPGPVKVWVFGPGFVFISALGISRFLHVQPFGGAVMMAIVPTFSIYNALLVQLPDMVPEMGELVCRLDPRVKQPLDLRGVFKWLGRRLK